MAIVDALADRWGVHERPGSGKEVWFDLVVSNPGRKQTGARLVR